MEEGISKKNNLVDMNNYLIMRTYEYLNEYSIRKGLEIGKTLYGIREPISENRGVMKSGLIRFNNIYCLRYYILTLEKGMILVKLYKNGRIVYDDELGFSIDKKVKVTDSELCHIVDKMDYILLKIPKKLEIKIEKSLSIKDPHGKEEIIFNKRVTTSVPLSRSNVSSTVSSNTVSMKEVSSNTVSMNEVSSNTYTTSLGFNLSHWWQSINNLQHNYADEA